MRRYVLVLPVVALLLAADKPTADMKKELKKFQGTWIPVSVEANGKPVPREDLKDLRITFKGQRVTRKIKDDTAHATFSVDPSPNPKWFDATGVREGKEVSIAGIYKFDRGRLTLCIRYNPVQQKRPTEFSTKAGTKESPLIMVVLKKRKARPK
jgi:uncharacterized protein (TIGR03067 family)